MASLTAGSSRSAKIRPAAASAGGGARALLATLAVALALLAGGCASVDEADPADIADARLPDVSAAELARELGLAGTTTDMQVALEAADGSRIVLFPGTRVASVAGTKLELSEPSRDAGGDVWITADDADAVRATWATALVNGGGLPGRSAVAGRVPLPAGPAPRPTAGTLPRPSARDFVAADAVQPSAAERASWSVPLRRTWRFIIVHHSASATGSAGAIDRWHRDKGWDGLGYDFVIGNGTGSKDGAVEVGYRWRRQIDGAHTKTAGNVMNEQGIGICLVGDFTRTRPTAAQMRALTRLCVFLSTYCGIPPANLRLHGDVKSTDCPGRYFPRDFEIPRTAGDSARPVRGWAASAPGTR